VKETGADSQERDRKDHRCECARNCEEKHRHGNQGNSKRQEFPCFHPFGKSTGNGLEDHVHQVSNRDQDSNLEGGKSEGQDYGWKEGGNETRRAVVDEMVQRDQIENSL
jgi:hypothetical protein